MTKLKVKGIEAKIEELTVKGEKWKVDYNRSNASLYQILAGCYQIVTELPTNIKAVTKINELVRERGIRVTKNTHLTMKVIKLVLDIDRKLASRYSIVLRRALNDSIKPKNLVDWITKQGGVNMIELVDVDLDDDGNIIKKNDGGKAKENRTKFIEAGRLHVKHKPPFATLSDQSVPENADGIVITIGVVCDNGKIELVDFLDSSYVDDILLKLGMKLANDNEQVKKKLLNRPKAKAEPTVVSEAVAV